ncbi:MAG: transcription termination factor Rho [Acidimicrobiia bacterium]|nr:transcription termination factor Rho [Acidimicrobiia bacterium]
MGGAAPDGASDAGGAGTAKETTTVGGSTGPDGSVGQGQPVVRGGGRGSNTSRPAAEPSTGGPDRASVDRQGGRPDGQNRPSGNSVGGQNRQGGDTRGNQNRQGGDPDGDQGAQNRQRADQGGDRSGQNRQGGNQQGGNQQGGQNRQGGDPGGDQTGDQDRQAGQDDAGPGNQADPQVQSQGDEETGNRRRRRRGRDRDRRPEQGDDQGPLPEPVAVEGVVDLRDEGYGFLRIAGYLPSRDDAYISVKQARQFGLRKGDTLKGRSRPANRNEKNPALLQIDGVNGGPASGDQPARPDFDDLTPLFPDSPLRLEQPEFPENMTARIIDLLAPIGKGQRGLIVSPPKAGKTTVMKQIVRAVERNHPEVHLIVLLVDERPEEVTDMKRWLINGEVAASTFDRPTEEHIAVAELVIERAKRLVESGKDVVVVLDGITRLARAYNLSAPNGGRTMAGGIDTGALYPPKKFFGAARNVEEGGSLTILATALVETNTRMDEVIFEEFKGTGNMELKLDRRLADRRIFPAIDVDASSTRHEELLYDRKQLQQIYRLRRVLSGLKVDGGSSGAGLEMLTDRLKTFKTNAAFLDEIAKTPSQG